MKTLFSLLILSLFCFGETWAQAPAWEWAVQSNGLPSGNVLPGEICVDHFGNTYTLVYYSDTVSFGDSTFIGHRAPNYGVLLLKYDPDGKILWIRNPIGNGGANYHISLDSGGNFYFGGPAHTDLYFENGLVAHNGLFIAKFDSNGSMQSINQLIHPQTQTYSSIISMANDNQNNLYIIYDARGKTMFNGTTFNDDSLRGHLLIKYDSAGKIVWAKKPLFSKYKIFRYNEQTVVMLSLSVTRNGVNTIIYTAGMMNADTIFYADTFMNTIGVSAPTSQAFIARINSDGDCAWARNVDRHQNYFASGMALSVCQGNRRSDELHYVYVSGTFVIDPAVLGDTVHDPSPITNEYCFIAKYSELGSFEWEKKITSLRNSSYYNGGNIQGNNICVDESNNIYFSGNFSGSTDFNGTPVNSSDTNTHDEFVSKFDRDGNLMWFKQSGRSSNGSVQTHDTKFIYVPSGEALNHNNLYISSSFNKSVDFGPFHLIRNDSASTTFFLAKLGNVTSSVQPKENILHSFLTLSPNPVQLGEPLTIHLDGGTTEGIYELRISDVLGNFIMMEKINALGGKQDISLDISRLSSGTYIVELRSGNNPNMIFRSKFVKED
jgi:hypothetical protein